MARYRERPAPTDYVIMADKACLSMWVEVNQVIGTNGLVKLSEHQYREDASHRDLASLDGQSRDNSFPALLAQARALLDQAEKTYNLQRERQSRSN